MFDIKTSIKRVFSYNAIMSLFSMLLSLSIYLLGLRYLEGRGGEDTVYMILIMSMWFFNYISLRHIIASCYAFISLNLGIDKSEIKMDFRNPCNAMVVSAGDGELIINCIGNNVKRRLVANTGELDKFMDVYENHVNKKNEIYHVNIAYDGRTAQIESIDFVGSSAVYNFK